MTIKRPEQFLFEQGIGGAVINFVLCGGIGWLLFRGMADVPLWGQQSVAGDTLATAFLLPFLTCLIVTPTVRRDVLKGQVAGFPTSSPYHALGQWVPRRSLLRGVTAGVLCVVIVVPATVLVLGEFAAAGMRFAPFLAFKATFGALLGATVTPFLALLAICDANPARAA